MQDSYPIVEIFDSIQGEGIFIGCPVTFIRLAGCNLKCRWCDTDHSKFTWMSPGKIVEQINNPFVVITGGEPGLQNLTDLLQTIHSSETSFVAVETNGTFPMRGEYPFLLQWITCSPKPQSDYKIHPRCVPDELKYVVDENFHVSKIPFTYMDPNDGDKNWDVPIWLQPQGFDMANSAQKAYELVTMDKYMGRLRLGCQLHKLFNLR